MFPRKLPYLVNHQQGFLHNMRSGLEIAIHKHRPLILDLMIFSYYPKVLKTVRIPYLIIIFRTQIKIFTVEIGKNSVIDHSSYKNIWVRHLRNYDIRRL